MIFWIIGWVVYALIVGLIAKVLSPGEDPKGFLATLAIGVIGSFIGGFINFLLGWGHFMSTSGWIMGIIGAVIFCWLYKKFKLGFLD